MVPPFIFIVADSLSQVPQVQSIQVDWLSLLFKDAPMTGFFIWFMIKGFPQLLDLAKWGHSVLVTANKDTEQHYLGIIQELRTDRNEDRKLREAQQQATANLQLEIHEISLRVTDIRSSLSITAHPNSDDANLFRGTTHNSGILAGPSSSSGSIGSGS